MKKIVFTATMLCLMVTVSLAQKYAFIDTEYILSKIPEYKSAQEQLDLISSDYQKKIEIAFQEVDKLYKDYQAEKVLLSEDMRTKKEDMIIEKEKASKELQKKYFGKDGELFKKRQELVKPIQDQIYTAVKEIAETGNYAIIFDVSAGATILYTDPKYDKSDEVLKKLGVNK